jgi:hypothetical protein
MSKMLKKVYAAKRTINYGGGSKKAGTGSGIGRSGVLARLITSETSNNNNILSKQPEAEGGCPEKVVTITGGNYQNNTQLETLRGCTKIIGNLDIRGSFQPTFSIFDCLREITGRISIYNIATGLTTISGFGALNSVGGYFSINQNAALTTISGFGALNSVGGFFEIIQSAALNEISGFGELNSVLGNFAISNNAALTTISGFGALNSVLGNFAINLNGGNVTPGSNAVVTTVTGFGNLRTVPKGITGNLSLRGFSVAKLLKIAQVIVDNLINATTGTKTQVNLYTLA